MAFVCRCPFKASFTHSLHVAVIDLLFIISNARPCDDNEVHLVIVMTDHDTGIVMTALFSRVTVACGRSVVLNYSNRSVSLHLSHMCEISLTQGIKF